MPDETIAHYGPEFARLIGRDAWQGYGADGPKLDRMLRKRATAHRRSRYKDDVRHHSLVGELV